MEILATLRCMDTVPHQPWTTESFLAWEDRQEGKHEFDGRNVVPMAGGSVAHQVLVFNLLVVLRRLLVGGPFRVLHEMRARIGTKVRYPDVVVCEGPLQQTTRTLTDAVALFEVLSEDTAVTDRVAKLNDYAALPSARCYVLLEQTAMAATLFQREPGGPWIASGHTEGAIALPGLNVMLPLADVYQELTFTAQVPGTPD
jgi:Uma2 family endonuclease